MSRMVSCSAAAGSKSEELGVPAMVSIADSGISQRVASIPNSAGVRSRRCPPPPAAAAAASALPLLPPPGRRTDDALDDGTAGPGQ